MGKRLVQNITSEYFEAISALHKRNRVMVYVEGYDDIPFWRSIFDEFETPDRRFEISTPARNDLAKGKKVVLQFADQAGKSLILCVDSDFDYLFGDLSSQSRTVNHTPYLLQTYTYAIENYLCYPPSLHSVCVRATKKDAHIFDFEEFMAEYSRTIYPLFVWYAYAARVDRPTIFTLADFRNTVKINYINVEDNGEDTLEWLGKQVAKRLRFLRAKHQKRLPEVDKFDAYLREKGVVPEETHLYMQGHALLDNVVSVLVGTVCNALRKMAVGQILGSSRQGLPLNNELSSYNNSLSDVDELLKSNTGFRSCPLFTKLRADIVRMLEN
ncbi:Predicted ATP-binding protein involved in virulence [Rikenella microfusus]|uniref:Predicted ATP-binding protein involved in virulence n=2 Tax=Rikenella microfusus TaxID=28139 RepID=A0A379MNG8_9BACT|nr:Predicted ATP-binding protein involved in virulence [Rikenella microfusus]